MNWGHININSRNLLHVEASMDSNNTRKKNNDWKSNKVIKEKITFRSAAQSVLVHMELGESNFLIN